MYDVVLGLAALIFLAMTFWFVRSGYFSVFHPFALYLAFHGFLFVFRPILSYTENFRLLYDLYDFYPTQTDKITAILVSNIGLLSFAFFCFRKGAVPMRFSSDHVSILERKALVPPFLMAGLICFPIAFYSALTSWNQASSDALLAAQMMDKTTRIMINVSQNGYATDAQLMLASLGAILAWLFRFKLLAVLPLAAFVVLRAGTGGRGPFVAGAATLCLLWLYDQRKKWPSWGAWLGLALLVATFTLVGSDRGRTIRQFVGTDSNVPRYYSRDRELLPLEGMDFANLEYLEYDVYTIPQRTHTYSYFTQELELFTGPIPRILWPGKPVGPPIKMFNLFDYGNPVGMTVTVAGIGWASGGWFGVVIWCGFWGYALGWLYRSYADGPQSAFQTAAYMVFLSSLIVAFRDGSLVSLGRENLFFLAPILLWLVFSAKLGIPSAAEVRRRLTARTSNWNPQMMRNSAPKSDLAGSSPAQATTGTQRLPPAVVRRRAALAASSKAHS